MPKKHFSNMETFAEYNFQYQKTLEQRINIVDIVGIELIQIINQEKISINNPQDISNYFQKSYRETACDSMLATIPPQIWEDVHHTTLLGLGYLSVDNNDPAKIAAQVFKNFNQMFKIYFNLKTWIKNYLLNDNDSLEEFLIYEKKINIEYLKSVLQIIKTPDLFPMEILNNRQAQRSYYEELNWNYIYNLANQILNELQKTNTFVSPQQIIDGVFEELKKLNYNPLPIAIIKNRLNIALPQAGNANCFAGNNHSLSLNFGGATNHEAPIIPFNKGL